MTRGFQRSLCRVLAAVVLMAQLAVSAHACPGPAALRMQRTEAASSSGLPGNAAKAAKATAEVAAAGPAVHPCAGMSYGTDAAAPAFANLCAEHCHYGEQSDQTCAVKLPVAFFSALYTAPTGPAIGPSAAPAPWALAASPWPAASPRLAILHCCFRI